MDSFWVVQPAHVSSGETQNLYLLGVQLIVTFDPAGGETERRIYLKGSLKYHVLNTNN